MLRHVLFGFCISAAFLVSMPAVYAQKVETSENKNVEWIKQYFARQYIYIIRDGDSVVFAEDGTINLFGIMGKEKTVLREKEVLPGPMDHHASSSYTVSAILPDAVELTYRSSFDHRSFGPDLITKDSGVVRLVYSPAWVPAVYDGDVAKVKELLSEGLDVNSRDGFGRTPLMLAVHQNHGEIAKLLIDNGADPNARQSEGVSVLAIARRDLALVKLLVAAGADVTAQDDDGLTVLMCIAGDRSMPMENEIYKFLIASGADPDLKNKWGTSANDFLKMRLEEDKKRAEAE